jgi:hypothetical protein
MEATANAKEAFIEKFTRQLAQLRHESLEIEQDFAGYRVLESRMALGGEGTNTSKMKGDLEELYRRQLILKIRTLRIAVDYLEAQLNLGATIKTVQPFPIPEDMLEGLG